MFDELAFEKPKAPECRYDRHVPSYEARNTYGHPATWVYRDEATPSAGAQQNERKDPHIMDLTSNIAERVGTLDWARMEHDLDELGYAVTPRVLGADECDELAGLFDQDERFRSTIDMRRYRFGSGVYRYFDYPLPGVVRELREGFYPPLARVANRWASMLNTGVSFPDSLHEFLTLCHEKGQIRPTPLILHYETGDHNALHQDVYGAIGFPFQVLTVLSRREEDYTGGEFLLLTQRPRAQSVGEAITLDQGQMLVFPNQLRPMEGKRGYYRVNVRHGVSRLRSGERYSLGIIFHDAE